MRSLAGGMGGTRCRTCEIARRDPISGATGQGCGVRPGPGDRHSARSVGVGHARAGELGRFGAQESYRGRRISSGSALSEQLKRYRCDVKSTFGKLWAQEEAGLEAERARVASSLVSDQRDQSELRSKYHTIGDKWDKRCWFLAGGAGPY